MARIAVGGFMHETNTFAPDLATYREFEKHDGWRGVPARKISATSKLSRGMTPPDQAGGGIPCVRCSSGLLTSRMVLVATWL